MAELETRWNERHKAASPWDSGQPCAEVLRVLAEHSIARSRALELGCGIGREAVALAQRGFEVSATDVSNEALERARAAAIAAGVVVDFFQADVLQLPEVGAPFPFVLDRGLYQHTRTERPRFEKVLERITHPGSLYLVIAPSINDDAIRAPRAVRDYDLCLDYARLLRLVQLREVRFAPARVNGREVRPLMWSALFVRK